MNLIACDSHSNSIDFNNSIHILCSAGSAKRLVFLLHIVFLYCYNNDFILVSSTQIIFSIFYFFHFIIKFFYF